MVDHLTSWPIVKAIPNAIFEKLILEHGSPEILLSDNWNEVTNDTLAYVCQEFRIEQYLLPLILPGQMAKQRILLSSSKPQKENCVRKTKVHGIKFLTKFCLHISVAHTHLLVRLHTHLYTIQIHQYPYIN